MTQFLTPIRRGISAFFAWWGGELAALVPEALRRRFQADTGQIVFDISGAGIMVDQVFRRSHREIGRVAARADDAAVEAAALAPLIGKLKMNRFDLVLRMPAAHALRRSLSLPRAAADNLRQVLTFEMDRQTPFSADQVYFDYLVDGSPSAETIDVELIACPKGEVDAAVERSRAWGVNIDIVDIAGAASGAPARINLLPRAPDLYRSVLELQALDPLVEVRGVSAEVHRVADPQLSGFERDDSGVGVGEVVTHHSDPLRHG